jgi:hypothetical protein
VRYARLADAGRKTKAAEARALYQAAARCVALDALERLDADLVRRQLKRKKRFESDLCVLRRQPRP